MKIKAPKDKKKKTTELGRKHTHKKKHEPAAVKIGKIQSEWSRRKKK